MEDRTTFLNIRTDYGFKRVFGSAKNKQVLIRLLNALMGDQITVTDIVYHDKELLSEDDEGKRIVYDVYCTSVIENYTELRNGRIAGPNNPASPREHHFILEMQNQYEPPFEDRVLYYTSKPISAQGNRGWEYRLDPVVTIVITDFDFKHMEEKLIRHIGVADLENGEIFSDKLQIFTLSLRQLRNKSWEECNSEIEQILYLIQNMDKLNKKSKPYLDLSYQEFFDAAETSSVVGEDYVCYSDSLQRLRSIERGMEYAYQTSYAEGRAEGLAAGRAEGLAEGHAEGLAAGRAEGLAEGHAEGRAEGRVEGVNEERVNSIRNMYALGINPEAIAECYHMSVADVNELITK